MATVFVSPGVYTKEQDFSVYASRIGLTRLGLIGLTLKGPAFEPIKIKSTDEFLFRFGTTNENYELPYVANSFLKQSDELTITRVLGGEGFTDSPAWNLTASFDDMYSGTMTISGITFTQPSVTDSTIYQFSAATNSVMADLTVSAATTGNNTLIHFSGDVTTNQVISALESVTNFNSLGITITGGDDVTTIPGPVWYLSATTLIALGSKSGATLAVIRSKTNDYGTTYILNSATDVKIGAASTVLSPFVISATTGSLTAYTNGIIVSLDESREDYIVNVLGKSPITGEYDIYVESIYPHFIREANKRGEITGLHTSTVFTNESAWTDYAAGYTNATTPWVVSRVIGSDVRNLFRFQTISDGNSSNEEIKISISNIDTVNKTFDVIIRAFDDTDSTASQTAYERFRTVTMDSTLTNFIGRAIGTTDEQYPKKSTFVTVDLADDYIKDTVPAGFRGYDLRNTSISGTTSPNIYYKTSYLSGDSVFKTYLGISELGYTGYTSDQVSVSQSIKTIEADLFKYNGATSTGVTTIKGFHLENTAPAASFIVGDEISLTAYTKNQRKFTLVPTGGFDGWNKFKTPTFTTSSVDVNNVASFKTAIDTMANPEEVDINLFATPDVNYTSNEAIVKYGLSMIEDRADALYIINSPRITVGTTKGTPEEVVSNLQDTGIDSNYAATYWPWIQIEDVNTNQYIYISPTAEVVRSIALTDNVAYPWFAPAGFNRGTTSSSVIRADIKLSKDNRDTLYDDRINPVATFVQQGVVIFGQKTLQIKQSSLDRINIRRLLLQVRRLIAAASQTLLFEQNDQTLRDQFLSKVEPILLQIQNQRGLTAFNVVMDETNNTNETIDRNQLNGKIQLKPTPTAEYINLDFQVLPSGANFEDF